MQRDQLIQKELSMICCRTLSSDDKARPGQEMSSHDVSVCVYFAQGLLKLLDHMCSFFWWRVENGALDIDVASEGGKVGKLGQ